MKYNQQLLKRALSEIEEVKLMQRTILAGPEVSCKRCDECHDERKRP